MEISTSTFLSILYQIIFVTIGGFNSPLHLLLLMFFLDSDVRLMWCVQEPAIGSVPEVPETGLELLELPPQTLLDTYTYPRGLAAVIPPTACYSQAPIQSKVCCIP